MTGCWLPVAIYHRGPHLSLVVYGVKTAKKAHVWVPALSQMINQIYIDATAWDVFTKRQLLSFKPLFLCCCHTELVGTGDSRNPEPDGLTTTK
jgi:hypothetical protein